MLLSILFLFAAVLLNPSLVLAALHQQQTINIILTPWCANSFRVQITPTLSNKQLYTPEYSSASSRLAATLIKEGLSDIPGALIDDCGPGAPDSPVPGVESLFTNGNLRATVSADGNSLSFSRVDSSSLYFTADFSLAPSANFA